VSSAYTRKHKTHVSGKSLLAKKTKRLQAKEQKRERGSDLPPATNR
jgi:hypothetical protein